MAATRKQNIHLYSVDGDEAPVTVKGLITASQGLFMPDAMVYVESGAGTLTLVATSAASDAIHGFLLEAPTAELAGSTAVNWTLAKRKSVYVVYCETSGTDTTMAQTNVGTAYGLTVSTTAGEIGYATLDIGNANDVFDVVDLMANVEGNKFTTADDPGAVLVRIIESVIDAAK